MREFFGYLIVLNRKVFICTVRDFLDDPRILINLEHLHRLFSIVHSSYASLLELLLESSLLLPYIGMRELDLRESSIWSHSCIDFVPDKPEDVLGISMNVLEDLGQSVF